MTDGGVITGVEVDDEPYYEVIEVKEEPPPITVDQLRDPGRIPLDLMAAVAMAKLAGTRRWAAPAAGELTRLNDRHGIDLATGEIVEITGLGASRERIPPPGRRRFTRAERKAARR